MVMKLDMKREWYERKIADEGDLEVGAGLPDVRCASHAADSSNRRTQSEFVRHYAFGTLVQLLRRSKRLSIEELADATHIAPEVIVGIESDPRNEVCPDVAGQLASFFDLPENAIVQLSHPEVEQDTQLRNAMIRFASRTSTFKGLSHDEQIAVDEFVEFLSSSAVK
jgi:HTH-type transcriptional regulator, competence development regulator